MLPCTNCDKLVDSKAAKFFGADKENNPVPHAAVFVCPDCYEYAMRVVERDRKQLLMLARLQMENVRIALTQKRLFPGTVPPSRDLSMREVLEEALRLQEGRDAFMAGNKKPS